MYEETFRPQSASGRLYTVFHVFRGGQPDLPAASGCTGRGKLLVCLCRPCGQRHRPAHRRRCGGGSSRQPGRSCRAGAPGLCPGVRHSGLPVHRAVSGHSPHSQHLVPDAGAAAGQPPRAADCLLGSIFRCGIPGGTPPGKAHRMAGAHPLPLPDFAHRLPGACCTRFQRTTERPAQSTPLCPPWRECSTATRPWTRWQL